MWLIALVAVCLVLSSGVSSAAAEAKTEWILEQSGPTWGDSSIFVSPDAVRIVNHKFGFEEICTAPNWKARYFKARKNESPNAEFDYRLLFYSVVDEPNSFVQAGTGNFHGQKCILYLEPHVAYTLCVDDFLPQSAKVICDYYHVPNFRRVPIANIYTIATPREAAELLPECKLPQCNGNTPAPGAPKHDAEQDKLKHDSIERRKGAEKTSWLAINSYGQKSEVTHFKFVTKSIRHVALNKNDFLPPVGAKPCTDPKSVVLDTNRTGQIEDMIDSLGFSSDRSRAGTSSSAHSKQGKKP